MSTEPLNEYSARLQLRRDAASKLDERDRLVAFLRLAIAAAFLLTAWLIWGRHALPGLALAIPVGAFVGLALYHERIHRQRSRLLRAIRFYEHGVARIEDRWQGLGRSDFMPGDETHLYAADLDIFGKGSLFQLLCTARTRAGEDTLARWLCEPAARNEILARQEAVQELRGNLNLREDIALLGDEIRSTIRPELAAWSSAPNVLDSRVAPMVTRILAALNVLAVAGYAITDSQVPALVILPISIVFARVLKDRVLTILAAVQEPHRELRILGLALRRLERETFQAPKLAGLKRTLDVSGRSASSEIDRLMRMVTLAESRENQFFRPISYPLMWATQCAFAIENWRCQNGPRTSEWLAAVGEIEALCALAGFAYEHPTFPFPQIAEQGAVLEAEEARHPLLPASQSVPNSIRLDGELRLLVVSGSNMSGKSTLLRTAGINTALALAGAPVCAKRLRVSPLNMGATLRIQDSLQTGTSRFYAEIQRLRRIVELAQGPLPTLFLLDEILHGTNSHDRATGAEAVVRGLVNHGAIGLVTTHDLALAQVAEALAPRAANVHFEDHMENGRMAFDYRLQAGVVKKSNALELMRAVGLDV